MPLRELAALAAADGRIAIDTEFMGEGRYRTLLCLVQVAVADGESTHIEVIDPLPDELEYGPLAELLADPDIEVVVHAGRQDIALLRRRFATEVRNIFDTQIAAGFVGMPAQSSYPGLLAEILHVHLSKSASFTRWNTRPLSEEQLRYAREDVANLLDLASELQRRLQEVGRLGWAREECEFLEQVSDERDPESIFARLPRAASLNATARPVARELVRWRERTAERQNRPVQSVLGDATLMEIAKRMPSSQAQLERIRGANVNGSLAQEVLEAVRLGQECPAESVPTLQRPPAPKPADAALVALGESLLRARARQAGLAYELIATRAELQAIVAAHRTSGEADARALRGWRRELVGEELLRLLDGEVSLSVSGSTLRIDP
jgi:ribonuclease D